MNAAGIKLKNVCATDAARIVAATKINMVSNGTRAFKKWSFDIIIGETARKIRATLFGWMPGTSPVKVPNSTPKSENAISSTKGMNASIID
jgi:hypothetical protein